MPNNANVTFDFGAGEFEYNRSSSPPTLRPFAPFFRDPVFQPPPLRLDAAASVFATKTKLRLQRIAKRRKYTVRCPRCACRVVIASRAPANQ